MLIKDFFSSKTKTYVTSFIIHISIKLNCFSYWNKEEKKVLIIISGLVISLVIVLFFIVARATETM